MIRHANVAIFVPNEGCPRRCVFCDQRGVSGSGRMPSDEQVADLLRKARRSLAAKETSGAQIAFFGGSFTAIARTEMLRLLRAAQPFLGGVFSGIRVSTRPDAIDDEVLEILETHGVTAIELGAQSMDDAVLALSGRGHAAAQVAEAAALVRRRGFSLGLQMMTGLPGDSDEGAMRTARALAALEPDDARVYPALVLEGTELAARWRSGRYAPQTLAQAQALCANLLAFFTERGVRVIRLGLHDAPSLKAGLLAGPYHPAFRELCEGSVLLARARAALAGTPPGPVTLAVGRGGASKMAGQRQANREALAADGYRVKIIERDDVPYLQVRV